MLNRILRGAGQGADPARDCRRERRRGYLRGGVRANVPAVSAKNLKIVPVNASANQAVRLGVRLRPDIVAALDRFIAEDKPGASRPEALIAAFVDWANGRGYLLADPPVRSPAQRKVSEDRARTYAAAKVDVMLAGSPASADEKAHRRRRLTDKQKP
ncbi:MAG: hypothetical protein J0H01_37200 [Rhizobiales bacterium]|nr:hypothetical protein [Hyphomicrobiales bacterium]